MVDSSSFNCAMAHNERVLLLGRLILGSLNAWRPTGRLEMRKTERNEGDFDATYWGLSGGMICVLTAFSEKRTKLIVEGLSRSDPNECHPLYIQLSALGTSDRRFMFHPHHVISNTSSLRQSLGVRRTWGPTYWDCLSPDV